MAAVNDCFTIGSTVCCTTCFNDEVEGEVLAFDHNTKMLILKCHSKNSEELNDVYVLNLSLCSNVHVIKECNDTFSEEPQKLNLEQVKIRLKKTVQRRQTDLKSRNTDVSAEAQELYRVIAKQFKTNEVSWQGLNIKIFNEVTISPPYRVENVESSVNNKTLCNYITKLIEQFTNMRSAQENVNAPAGVGGGGTSTSSVTASSSSTPSSSSASVGANNAAAGSPVPTN